MLTSIGTEYYLKKLYMLELPSFIIDDALQVLRNNY